MLPGEIVIVVERIIREDLGIRVGADIAGAAETQVAEVAVADALSSETHVLLCTERDADHRIAVKPKLACRVARNAVNPTNASKTKTKFVDDEWRKSVNKARARNLRWIMIVGGKGNWDQCRRKIAASSLRIECIDPANVCRSPINFEILLIV